MNHSFVQQDASSVPAPAGRMMVWQRACLMVCCLLVIRGVGLAQPGENPADKTLLEIEILMPALGTDPTLAQEWRKLFENLDVGVRIRTPISSDALKVEEQKRGPFRLVRLVGEIGRDGTLRFPGRSFTLSQQKELGEYVGELKTFGAQGSPTGKPLWGLQQAQYDAIVEQLRPPVPTAVKGQTFAEVLAAIPKGTLTLSFHSSAEPMLRESGSQVFSEEVQGLSAGTALAFVLSQAGLGFRPLRTPSGSVELIAHPLSQAPDAWPVGQPMREDQPRDVTAPGLFRKVETGVNPSPLSAMLDVIEAESGVRILVDWRACLAKQLHPDELLVSYPRGKTAWALIVSSIVVNSHMTMNYRQDEAGTAFLFITPFEHYQPPRRKEPMPPVPAPNAPQPQRPSSLVK